MRITYDPQVDALYISLSNGKRATQKHIDDNTTLDLDAGGEVVGIEILDAKATHGNEVLHLEYSLIGDVIEEERYTAEEAAGILKVNKETVLRKIRVGDIKAKKDGRGYLIGRSELNRHLSR